MGVLDILGLVLDGNVPLKLGDRFVVPLVSGLARLNEGKDPEAAVERTLFALAFTFLAIDLLGLYGGRSRLRVVGFISGLILFALQALCRESLAPKTVQQEEDAYGKLAFTSAKELPLMPLHGRLTCDGPFFRDEQGRVTILRGVNLGGDTKVPVTPPGASYISDKFYEYEHVSFIGRPFPLEEADEHLGRLRSWGFTFLRFLVTWEAVEHRGPGEYDYDYLAYLVAVVRKCREHGISVFIDPHQDVWSRWTGGDGAPAWTLTKVGFDLKALYKSGAAITHQEFGDPFPQMVWPTNYNRLAAATMFTLFFAGDTFAPNTMVDGQPVQQFLQGHYLGAMREVAKALKGEPNVLGYDTLNEPSPGYSGLGDLNRALFAAPMGWFMSGFQGMVLGAGFSLPIPFFSGALVFSHYDTLNPAKVSAWQSEKLDVWRNEKVWAVVNGEPKLLRPDHFARNKNGDKVHFLNDFMVPFFERFRETIHNVHPDVVIFAEPYIDPNSPVHDPAPKSLKHERYAWAPHYYDATTLLLKKAREWFALDVVAQAPVIGKANSDAAISNNLGHVREMGRDLGGKEGGGPVLVGEIGIPFDLDRDPETGLARAYRTGDFSSQILVLDRTMRALESNLLSYTVWNYAAGNSNRRGDMWNDEDLSLFSRDQQKVPKEINLHSGGRALQAAVRPYPFKTRGTPIKYSFSPFHKRRTFLFEFSSGPEEDPKSAPTIIFVPSYQYPNGVDVTVSDGSFTLDLKNQMLEYRHDPAMQDHVVRIEHKS